MFQIVVLIITLAFGGVYFFMINKPKFSTTKDKDSKEKSTAQDFVNVKEIKDRFVYTKDGHVYMYIKLNSISVDLFSEREKKHLTRSLTAELSSEQEVLKFIAVSRPVDITPLINEYNDILINSNDHIQKTLLRQEMMIMNDYAMSGDVVERQFYLMIWNKLNEDAEKNLSKRALDIMSKFESEDIKCHILKEQDIIRFLNLFSNPAYINIEDTNFDATIPLFAK